MIPNRWDLWLVLVDDNDKITIFFLTMFFFVSCLLFMSVFRVMPRVDTNWYIIAAYGVMPGLETMVHQIFECIDLFGFCNNDNERCLGLVTMVC